ncbi:ExbD/TolR family protein [Paraburkholderia lycopersici]|uniref:Biopolymer transport protein ExbD n=1 Tax=Paraburkholderia lycopersici TaxID=416944 RepID=A0A1G6HAJ1_9BURK|nr:biopolymer transporter ExbD [Paraburkholderia lycopersici]SDB91164.1 biopolymer transport protein ExbD [Paraburkholderia lycopersici]
MAFSTSSDNDEVLGEINITPLVDVMLVLLVAFIVTAPLLNNAVHVNLPKTATTAPPQQVKAVTVSVDAQGKVFVDKRELPLALLEAELRARVAVNKDLALNLQADEGVPYGTVAKAMAAIERSGVSKLSVLTANGG